LQIAPLQNNELSSVFCGQQALKHLKLIGECESSTLHDKEKCSCAHDNTCLHSAAVTIEAVSQNLNFCQSTPPYSPGLALTDYHRFLPLGEV